ncbi:hypothetical protein Tco_1461066, partial [Tanacetum coccineum]
KSTNIFGSMKVEDQQEILKCVPFNVEKLPVKYLGVPLTSKRHKTKGGLGLKDLDVRNKCRSIWAIDEESNESWGWNNILKIRKEVRHFIVMKIGNGEKVSVTYDNWCGVGILQSFIANRDLCNVRGNAEKI